MKHSQVFSDLLERPAPDRIDLVESCVAALGWRSTGPFEIVDCHPLVTPFAVDVAGAVGLLHWPTPQPGIATPVVRNRGQRLELLAPDLPSWLRQQLARLDHRGELPDELLEQSNGLVLPGEIARAGLEPDVWAVLKGGGNLRVYRGLSDRHIASGDATSALVTAERATDRYPGWGEPHAWRFRIHSAAGDTMQARDAATAALGLPIWTLLSAFAPLAAAIGWEAPHDGATYRRLSRDSERLPADRAAYLMDSVAVDGGSWADVRQPLAELYTEAELTPVARLVLGGSDR